MNARAYRPSSSKSLARGGGGCYLPWLGGGGVTYLGQGGTYLGCWGGGVTYLGQGGVPTLTGGGEILTLAGVPPGCGQTNKLKLLPSPHPTDAGGNNGNNYSCFRLGLQLILE